MDDYATSVHQDHLRHIKVAASENEIPIFVGNGYELSNGYHYPVFSDTVSNARKLKNIHDNFVGFHTTN